MNNPFLENGFLLPIVSINKLFIAKMPSDKVKQNLTGLTALDIFSTKLFIEEIKANAHDLKIDLNKASEKDLPKYLGDLLISQDNKVQSAAEKIAKKFGERLGVILLTLKLGEKENRIQRKDWTHENWDYWKTIKNVILTGGLASSILGQKLKYYAEKVFNDAGVDCYNIILNKDSANAAIRGCSNFIANPDTDKKYLIFDCGQSFIKRSIVQFKNKDTILIKNLEKISSENVIWKCKNYEEEKIEALKLHNHIVNTILDTIKTSGNNLGLDIVMSIANYVENGHIANRGGYGKLRLLADNYEEFLKNALYEKTNSKFKITLVHDGTAMANAFKEYKNAVCISLGTAFGVGFPSK